MPTIRTRVESLGSTGGGGRYHQWVCWRLTFHVFADVGSLTMDGTTFGPGSRVRMGGHPDGLLLNFRPLVTAANGVSVVVEYIDPDTLPHG